MKINIETKMPEYVDFLKHNRTKEQAKKIYEQRLLDAREIYDKYEDGFFERPCPICGTDEYSELDKFDNRYSVALCRSCATKYVNPCPSLDALNYYYNNCECNNQLGDLLRSRIGKKSIIMSDRHSEVVDLIKQLLKTKSHINILEVGCSSGVFLAELSSGLEQENLSKQVTMTGIDIDEDAVKKSVSADVELVYCSVEEFCNINSNKYDLVLHFELIEHLSDPFLFMKSISQLLCSGGKTYFTTPNADGFDNLALGYNDFRPIAHGIFPPMHLQAFTPRNIVHFLLRSGIKVEKIETPGNFDVDQVRRFIDPNKSSPFSYIKEMDEKTLAIIQSWLKLLGASSHLSITGYK